MLGGVPQAPPWMRRSVAHPELLALLLRRTCAEHHLLAAMGQAGVSEPLKELDIALCNNPETRSF